MRRLLIVAALIAAPLATGFVRDGRAEKGPPADGPKTVGVAGCAAAACHNANDGQGAKGSEYSTWVAVDPHAKAYRALFNADSARIQKNLGGGDAHKNGLCVACHGMGPGASPGSHADGVGCEQCHGPAEKWKATHYLRGFDRTTAGFRDLRDVPERAASCMKCHVGDATREVNHDLIAAGHPRLRFEFAAYYANYPKHWKERAGEAELWLVGQLASSRAALELLASRAERGPWPEFAEYDCMACHHDLKDEDARRERAGRMRERGLKPGDLPWAAWYHGLPHGMAGAELKGLYTGLEKTLAARRPDAARVATDARTASKLLVEWEAKAAKGLKEEEIVRLVPRLAGRTDLVRDGWDGAAQVYLGLTALNAARGDPAARKDDLAAIRRELRGSYPEKARTLYDLPSRYDAKRLLPLLKNFE